MLRLPAGDGRRWPGQEQKFGDAQYLMGTADMVVSRLYMYTKKEGVHRAIITERNLFLMASGCRRVNSPRLCDFCVSMIGRADIEGSKSNVAMNAWLPQASYPCGNFCDTSK